MCHLFYRTTDSGSNADVPMLAWSNQCSRPVSNVSYATHARTTDSGSNADVPMLA